MAKAPPWNSPIQSYAYRSWDEICRDLGTSREGLPEESVDAMRERCGDNSFAFHRQDPLSRRILRAFLNPFHVVLLILAVVSAATDVLLASDLAHSSSTPAIIFSMILVSGTIRLIQEMRANHAVKRLNQLIHEDVMVKRSGQWRRLPVKELVVGDLIAFGAGDRIPADLRIIAASDLFLSQAAITGESAVSEKTADPLDAARQMPLTQLPNLAFMATSVIGGRGEGVVLAVGKKTLYGSQEVPDHLRKNVFQAGASSIAWVMLRFMGVMIPLVFLLLGITNGKWLESFGFALSVSVGLVPEMLPMVITACLAKGSLAMSRKKTIVKDINAMKCFGSMDVLCMDKTGTITNESILLEYYMDVLGNECSGVLDLAYLNSAYHSGVCNPIDNAVMACKTMPGQEHHYDALLQQYRKLDEFPFDYTRKSVSVLVENGEGGCELILKGDISYVVSRCAWAEYRGQLLPMGPDSMANVSSVVDDMLQDGMKVIAVARKPVAQPGRLTLADETGMILMGYIAFFDAPKSTAKTSVAALHRLKVTPKILTGDQSAVAVSVCRRVGIDAERVLTGAQIDAMSDLQLQNAAEQVHVFAELTPGQKMRLVAALQSSGHTVGFLGDGINDIPAMNEADVGISVDTAVDAAKDAADVILLQKDLTILEQGILEGRKTFTNMVKYVKITASSNFGNILAIVCASAFLPFLPMTPLQILLLNLLYDCLCIVLPWDHVDQEELYAPREWSGKHLSRFMLCFGPISSFFDIATFLFLYRFLCPLLCGGDYGAITDPAVQRQFVALFQTGWFLESMWTQVLILHFLRTSKLPFVQSRPAAPVVFVTLAGLIAFTGITFTAGGALFGLTRLPAGYFAFLGAAAVLYMIFATVCKSLYFRKYHELL